MRAVQRCLVTLASIVWLLAGLATAETVSTAEDEPATSAPAQGPGELSQSDRLTQLQKALAFDEEKLERLKREHEQKIAEYDRVNDLRETLDIQIEELRGQLANSDDPEQQSALEKKIAELSIESRLGRKHTDLLIEASTTLKEQADALALKIEADRAAFDVQTGVASPKPQDAAPPPAATAPTAATTTAEPAAPMLPGRSLPSAGQAAPVPQAGEAMKESAAQIEARIQAERMEQKAMVAEREIVDFLDRKQALEQQIELEKSLISSSRDAVANLKEAVALRRAQHTEAVAAGVTTGRGQRPHATEGKPSSLLRRNQGWGIGRGHGGGRAVDGKYRLRTPLVTEGA